MSNNHLRDRNLSYKIKGMFSFMLLLSDDQDYSMDGFCEISKESRYGIRSIIRELEEYHYVKLKKLRVQKDISFIIILYMKSLILKNTNMIKIIKIWIFHIWIVQVCKVQHK